MDKKLTVGIGGFGAVGQKVAEALDDGIEGLELKYISVRDHEKAKEKMASFGRPVPIVGLAELSDCDIVVEGLPSDVFDDIADPAINRGRIFVPTSVGQLLPRPELILRAKKTGARIIAPTGALLGLDAVRAAAEGEIYSVNMITRKPPNGLKGAPHLVENNISVDGLKEAKLVFKGSAREGAVGFPANVNVAAALALAGIGPDRTTLEIWADPEVDRNMHRILVEADSCRFLLEIANVPSDENPRTGKNTALSVITCLKGLTETLKIGS